jgi:hypothetical protein
MKNLPEFDFGAIQAPLALDAKLRIRPQASYPPY